MTASVTTPVPEVVRRASSPAPPVPKAAPRLSTRAARTLLGPAAMPAAVGAAVMAALAAGAVLRFADLDAVGYNSDEAVYAGQAASLAGDPDLIPYFPVFRAHPLLFQTVLSLAFQDGVSDVGGRALGAFLGVATVLVTYLLGRELYGAAAGALAALVMACMPYHVVVTRQVLLDGPMTLWATVTLLMLARYARTGHAAFLYAGGGSLGLAMLSKETSVILLGAAYAFFALTPSIRLRVRALLGAGLVWLATLLAFPVSMVLAGSVDTGGSFLAWQLLRRPNHTMDFYVTTVPAAVGWGTLLAGGAGLWWLRSQGSWRETLLLCWISVPALFFQAWPTKGFQYLLPIAPALAVLAARALVGLPELLLRRWPTRHVVIRCGAAVAAGALLVSLALPSWARTHVSGGSTFLAGSGGVPGGREAGLWIRQHVPVGSRLLTVGPSMANILQFYGHRRAYGLSVSPNPLHRNPVYEPVPNPDLMIRHNDLQYLVWDSFSAGRSPFFSQKLMRYVARYHGRVVHTEIVTAAAGGAPRPVIVIYEVRP